MLQTVPRQVINLIFILQYHLRVQLILPGECNKGVGIWSSVIALQRFTCTTKHFYLRNLAFEIYIYVLACTVKAFGCHF